MERLRPARSGWTWSTGTGATVVAQAVGAQGRVHAIDLSERMLDRAFAHQRKRSLPNADRLDFKSTWFEYVICAFGLFFVPDVGAALLQDDGLWLNIPTLLFTRHVVPRPRLNPRGCSS